VASRIEETLTALSRKLGQDDQIIEYEQDVLGLKMPRKRVIGSFDVSVRVSQLRHRLPRIDQALSQDDEGA
jgi:hypothetical protein